MAKIVANQFRIGGGPYGTSHITFYGKNNREIDVEFKTSALMGLALELRKAARQIPIPLAQRATTDGRKPLSGPPVPIVEDTSGGAPPGSTFGVGISADFHLICTWFNFYPKEGESGTRITFDLSVPDAERLASDLTKAIAVAKTKPSAPSETKH
jgi:hypothetical protein